MTDFDDRDLVRIAAEVGFTELHLELRIDVGPGTPRSWDGFLHSSPNPLAPTFSEAVSRVLSEDEATQLLDYIRPQVERGGNYTRSATAFLAAVKR